MRDQRHFRQSPDKDTTGHDSAKGGSFADQASELSRINTNNSASGEGLSQASKPVDSAGKGAVEKEAAKAAEKKAATKATEKQAAKAVAGKLTKGQNVAGDIQAVKSTAQQDGKAAAASVAAVRTAEELADATRVGRVVTGAIRGGQAVAGFFGINIKDQYIGYVLIGIPLAVILIPLVILLLVVFFAWQAAQNILSLNFDGISDTIGFVSEIVIEKGGANKMAYEVDSNQQNTAIAAPLQGAPEVGTYEYVLAQIDWEKAKYQTLPNGTNCEIKTKKVTSLLDGKERSVIDSVVIKNKPETRLEGIARANCINSTYPIFNTIMRSQFIRDGIHAQMNIRYAYAEPQNSETLKQTDQDFQKTLRNKTLSRIWSNGQQINQPTSASEADVLAMDQRVEQYFFDAGINQATRTVRKYSINSYAKGAYTQEIIDCANNFIPPNPGGLDPSVRLSNFYQKNIDKMANDLKCGIKPKDLQLYTTFPEESLANSPDESLAIRPKRAALGTICKLYENLLVDESTEDYKNRIKNRINSAAIAGFQALTYADTNKERFLDIKEIGGDFYKISGMQSSQEYSHTLDSKMVGTQLEPDAVSRIMGYYNNTAAQTTGAEAQYIEGLQALFQSLDKRDYCDAVADADYSRTDNATVNAFWDNSYPKFKKAIAALDYYASPEKSTSISEIYKDLTYEDIFYRLIKIETNGATAGTEAGPQNFNRMNFGVIAYNNAVSLAMGGRFMTENEDVVMQQQTLAARDYRDQVKGIGWRLFDHNNPASLTSRLHVAMIDTPQNIPGNVFTALSNVLSPIRNAAGERGSLTAIVTGQSRSAQAASSYEMNNLKLDPAGLYLELSSIDPIRNAEYIENIKNNNPEKSEKFSKWDQCYKEFIPSRFHLLNPPAEKADLYRNYCQPLFDKNRDKNSDEFKYSAYHFAMLQANALVYLSNPDKEDPAYNAVGSQVISGPGVDGSGNPIGGANTGPNGEVVSDKPVSCSGGAQPGTKIMADFIMQKFGTRNLGIYNCRSVRGGTSLSLHGEGRAFDAGLLVSNPAEKQRGDELFLWAIQNAVNFGFQEVIWNRQIWTPARGIRAYTGTNPHTDHVHLGQNRAGAAGTTPFYTQGAGQ